MGVIYIYIKQYQNVIFVLDFLCNNSWRINLEFVIKHIKLKILKILFLNKNYYYY